MINMEKVLITQNMKYLTDVICERIDKNYDVAIAITGEEGTGKSTLGQIIAMQCMSNGDGTTNFNIERNIAFRGREIRKKIYSLKPKEVLLIDEAIKDFYKRGWMRADRRELNILFGLCRKQNLITIMILPNFFDLDTYYREHRIIMWIHVVKRGLAVIFLKDENIFSKDKWHKDENEKLIKRLQRTKRATFTELIRKTSNYVTDIKFRKLPRVIEKHYERVKEKFWAEEGTELDEVVEVNKWELRTKTGVNNLNSMGFTERKLGEVFETPKATIHEWLVSYNNLNNNTRKLK